MSVPLWMAQIGLRPETCESQVPPYLGTWKAKEAPIEASEVVGTGFACPCVGRGLSRRTAGNHRPPGYEF